MRPYLLIALLTGCAAVTPPEAPLSGQWGGPHIGLSIGSTGGQIDYDCASGTIGPVVPDAAGRFTAAGTHTPGHGGPVREDEVIPSHAATFTGVIQGNRMTLEGRVDNGVELGPFVLDKGAEPGIFRCL